MANDDLQGKRILVTEADAFMGPTFCSDAADCFVGQVFPVCGGWVPR